MHGTVTFEDAGTGHVATLDDDGRWTIEPPLPEGAPGDVPAQFDIIAKSYRGPADGPFGPKQLRQAADYLRLYGYRSIVVAIDPREPGPPDRIY